MIQYSNGGSPLPGGAPKVATEMAPHVLAYNLIRVMNIMDIQPLMVALVSTGQTALRFHAGRIPTQSGKAFPHSQDAKWKSRMLLDNIVGNGENSW
jgi:hypothetical protein